MAAVNYILKHNLTENARVVGSYFLTRLKELLEHPLVGNVRGLGMMVGFELVKDKTTKEPFPLTMWVSQRFGAAALERGLVVYPLFGAADGLAGDMIKMSPPLTTTKEQVDEIMDILHSSLQDIQAGLI